MGGTREQAGGGGAGDGEGVPRGPVPLGGVSPALLPSQSWRSSSSNTNLSHYLACFVHVARTGQVCLQTCHGLTLECLRSLWADPKALTGGYELRACRDAKRLSTEARRTHPSWRGQPGCPLLPAQSSSGWQGPVLSGSPGKRPGSGTLGASLFLVGSLLPCGF